MVGLDCDQSTQGPQPPPTECCTPGMERLHDGSSYEPPTKKKQRQDSLTSQEGPWSLWAVEQRLDAQATWTKAQATWTKANWPNPGSDRMDHGRLGKVLSGEVERMTWLFARPSLWLPSDHRLEGVSPAGRPSRGCHGPATESGGGS